MASSTKPPIRSIISGVGGPAGVLGSPRVYPKYFICLSFPLRGGHFGLPAPVRRTGTRQIDTAPEGFFRPRSVAEIGVTANLAINDASATRRDAGG